MPTPKGKTPRGPKKARWSANRKAEAKRVRRSGTGSATAGATGRPGRTSGEARTERPARSEKPTARGDRRSAGEKGSLGEKRSAGDKRPARAGERPGWGAKPPARGERQPARADQSTSRGTYGSARGEKPPTGDRRPPRAAERPARGEKRSGGAERPARADAHPARSERLERGGHGRVADPARRDRHEGRHVDRFGDRDPSAAQRSAARANRHPARDARTATDGGFAALGLPEVLVERLSRDGIIDPFPIQAATIPDALAGRDVLGRGQTGSGKTLAFGLPILARLAADGRRAQSLRPRVLILVPTRELAMQVSDALEPLVHVLGLRHRLVAGGLSYEPQISALARGVEMLIATPGRLADLVERGAVDLGGIETAILDEADHMADMGFLPEVSALLDLIPAGGQRLLFSATLDKGVDTLVERYLVDPVTHSTDDATASVTTMAHHIVLIDPQDKKALTAQLSHRRRRVIVFVRTQLGADRVAHELRERGVLAAALHGGLNQSVRNRVLEAFRDGRVPVLVATDVAARGIHVDDVGLVLQVDPPRDHKDYLHRAGRTARAGEQGTVATLVLPHQRRMMERLIESAGAEATTTRTRPGDATIRSLGGGEPSGVPVPEERWRPILEGQPRRGAGGRGGRRPPSRQGARRRP
jgi:superfamily II DNA/RNA helicase